MRFLFPGVMIGQSDSKTLLPCAAADFERQVSKHYAVITGTGRAGTTLLVRVLTRAGVDTGYAADAIEIDRIAHAGLEVDIRTLPERYVVKSPWLAVYVEEVLANPAIVLDHAIICVRDLYSAAESRRRVQSHYPDPSAKPPGGLWKTDDPAKQEAVLAGLFYDLVFHLSRHDIPITYLHFPRFAEDGAYLTEKLAPLFPRISAIDWWSALSKEVRPGLITSYGGGTRD